MTHKTIDWSGIADKLTRREFTHTQVRWLLAKGLRTKAETRGGEQRWSRRGWLEGAKYEAQVIYIERATELVMVSVHWILTAAELRRQEG